MKINLYYLLELLENNQKYIFLKGGKGGLGNSHFKSSTNQAPKTIYKWRSFRRAMDMVIS